MSVLSDRDIIRELGRGILFHPLQPGSIKACDLCLTASEYAYAIIKKQRLPIEKEPKPGRSGEEQKFFHIPPKDTALVWTYESVCLSNHFRAPLYSISSEVAKGIGHIGTRVNPGWTAVLCISLHNLSDKPLRINVQDVNQPIAYLAIEKLSSKSSINPKSDNPARLDLLTGLPNRHEIDDFFNQKENSWMKGNKELLRQLMVESEEYRKLKRGIIDIFLSYLGSDTPARWAAVAAIASIFSVFIATLTYINDISISEKKNTTIQTPETQVAPKSTVNPGSKN